MDLKRDDKNTLLKLAHRAALAAAQGEQPPDIPRGVSAVLQTGFGAFVTLRAPDGQLRGCIGTMTAHAPLVETVREMAMAAATRDARFTPVTKAEAEKLHIEISVLSPLEQIRPEDVVVGKHGLLVRKGYVSGVLLPQVPGEFGWDREKFLSQTCVKAGLTPDAWRERDTILYGFTAEVFGDEEL